MEEKTCITTCEHNKKLTKQRATEKGRAKRESEREKKEKQRESVVDRLGTTDDDDECCSAGFLEKKQEIAFFLFFDAPVVTFETKLRYWSFSSSSMAA